MTIAKRPAPNNIVDSMLKPTSPLGEMLRTSAERYPDHVLVHHLNRDWTYEEVWAHSACLCAWLREQGLQPGERVGLLASNSAPYIICYFGVLLAGGIVVALNPDTTPAELTHTLVHCGPAAVITEPGCIRHLNVIAERLPKVRFVVQLGEAEPEPCRVGEFSVSLSETLHVESGLPQSPGEVSETDVAQIVYTSGTTGRPKGVTLSHKNLATNCESIVEYLDLSDSDSVLVVLPFHYVYGNSLLVTHVRVGARLIIANDFVFWNRVLDLLEEQQATGFSGVPSTYAMLLHKSNFGKRTLSSLRYLTCAGGGLAPPVIREVNESVPGVSIFLMYGLTEAAARLSTLMPEDLPSKLGSIGKGISGVQLSVLDEEDRPIVPGQVGEIVAKGENIMMGYWNDPEATDLALTDKGLRTGDLARIDDDGYIYIVGRRSDLIKTGGYRISPEEIEEVILEVGGVVEVAVVGEPDEILGEVLVAFVVADEPSEEQILQYCRHTLPRYKQIRKVRFVDQLPKTSSGKVKRAELRGRARPDRTGAMSRE